MWKRRHLAAIALLALFALAMVSAASVSHSHDGRPDAACQVCFAFHQPALGERICVAPAPSLESASRVLPLHVTRVLDPAPDTSHSRAPPA